MSSERLLKQKTKEDLYISFCSASRFGKNIKDFEGGNIPPQRPSACSPQVQKKAEHRRFTPQTVYFSLSSTRSFVRDAPNKASSENVLRQQCEW